MKKRDKRPMMIVMKLHISGMLMQRGLGAKRNGYGTAIRPTVSFDTFY